MEIRQLKYFIAVAEERNISRAAARLHISQPPLTRHIQALEDDLGVQLFTRTNIGVELTQAGTLFLEHARSIKAQMELASHQARQAAAGHIGRIEVGVHGSAMLNVLPELLRRFATAYPQVQLPLLNAPHPTQLEALQQGRIQIAFDRNWETSDDIQVELVDREPLLVALSEHHPLAEQESIRIPQLRNEVLIGGLGRPYPRLLRLFQRHGFEPQPTQRATDMISGAIMAAGGFGIALVPASMASMQLPNLAYRPLADEPDALLELHCAYRRNDANPLLLALLGVVREFRESKGIHG